MIPMKMVEVPLEIMKLIADDITFYAKDIVKQAPESGKIADVAHDLHITSKLLLQLIGEVL